MTHLAPETLDLWALGALTPVEARDVDAHVASCRACAGAAIASHELATSLALALPPIAPRSQVRGRLLAAAKGSGRLERWTEQLASFFDFSLEKARGLLDAVDDPDAWEPGPIPGFALMHFSGGPKLATADCGWVRFPAGIDWPLHKHLGDEQMFIVEGGLIEDTGKEWREGSILRKPPGSQHSFKILPERDCLCAVTLIEGIEMPIGTRVQMR